MLLYDLRLECGFSILRDLDFHGTITAVYMFAFVIISIIIVIGTLRFLISEMIIHFCFHHFFNCFAQKIFQSILNIFGCLNIVFLQKLTDNVTFSFCHLYPMYGFLLFCHNKRFSYYNTNMVSYVINQLHTNHICY